jgi:hypothetical protein
MANSSTQAVVQRMLAALRPGGQVEAGERQLKAAAAPQTGPCGSGYVVEDFAVTYPNGELIANVQVSSVPAGVTLMGVTIAVSPAEDPGTTYCMAVAAEGAGLSLPVSVLAASTAPQFPSATSVSATVVIAWSQGGSQGQCLITQPFTVGG